MTPIIMNDPGVKRSAELIRLQLMMGRISKEADIKVVGKRYFVYTGGIWVPRDRDWMRPHAMRALDPENQTATNERAILDLCEGKQQTDHKMFRGAYGFNADNNILINTLDCVLEVRPDKVIEHPHSPDFHFTKQVQVVYNPKLVCRKFRQTLDSQLPCPRDRYLKGLGMANLFYPSAKFECALVEVGVTGTGKSTLAEPFMRMFGNQDDGRVISYLSVGQLCDSRTYGLSELEYAMVNLTTELQSLEISDSSNFKTIVSGETINVRDIYEKPRAIKTTAKIWALANKLPAFKGGSSAELRRLLGFLYNIVVTDEDRDSSLKPDVGAEKDAVFSTWLIPALQELMTLNAIPRDGTSCAALRERFALTNDPLGAFLAARCVFDPKGFVSRDHITNAMTAYYLEHDISEGYNQNPWRRLLDKHPELRPCRPGHLNRERGVMGLRLLPEG